MFLNVVPFGALIVAVVLAYREVRRRKQALADGSGSAPTRSELGWGIFFCIMLLAVGILGVLNMLTFDIPSYLVVSAVLVWCSWASFGRDRVVAWLGTVVQTAEQQAAAALTFHPDCVACAKYDTCANRTLRPEDQTRWTRLSDKIKSAVHWIGQHLRRPAAVRTIILMLAGVFALLALENPSNHDLSWAYPLCILLEWSIITALMVGLYHLFQRSAVAPAILAFALWCVGMAEYFVILFKSAPIQPADISAIATAAGVAAGYTYVFSPFGLYAMAFLAVSLYLCSLAAVFRAPKAERTRKQLKANLLVAAACLLGVLGHVTLIDYYNMLNITVYTWRPLESYYRQGFIPTFISSAQTIKPPRPNDYSIEEADRLLNVTANTFDKNVLAEDAAYTEARAQFDEEKPTVIAIMNETFADLSVYQNMHAGYEGPQAFKTLPDALVRGSLYTSAYGGGTCNTEFEFLTGNSMSYLGSGVYPYTIYDLQQTENLAAQFKNLGYSTVAMHPNHATNWNRENVYAGFGFDQFLAIQDFAGASQLRGMVTDEATYDKTLELIKNNPNPQFIFNVTMQNHSGYKTGLLPLDKQKQYLIDGESNREVNEFLSLIEESDRALGEFINELRHVKRKVVVVFFGDHQPYFPDRYNDAWYEGEDKVTHAERLWRTDYLVWANYDVAGNNQQSEPLDISSNYLGAEFMRLIGAPLSNYQKAQLSLAEALPIINTTGFKDRTGAWYLANTKDSELEGPNALAAAQARRDLATIQYYKLFGDGKDVYTKLHQSAANETDPNLAPGTTQIK